MAEADSEEPFDAGKATPMPTAWAVICPTCGGAIEVEMEETDSGSYVGSGPDQFPVCEACNAMIEVTEVCVQEIGAAALREPAAKGVR